MLIRATLSRFVATATAIVVGFGLGAGTAPAAGVERVPLDALGNAIGSNTAHPALSYDGRFLAFQTSADGLTPDDRNGVSDVYVYDHETRDLVRASGGFLGTFGNGHSVNPAISADGRYVVFASDSSALNLPIDAGQTVDVIDSNSARDIFVYDRQTRRTTAVSVWTDGRLFDDASDHPSVSADGRFVAFQSRGSTPGDPGGVWRVFVHDRLTGETRLVSVDSTGRAAREDSERPAVSADGRYVAFETDAALVRADTNGRRDVYRYRMSDGRVDLVSVSSAGDVAVAASRGASISADGSMVAFESGAANLVLGDTNSVPDIFVRDLNTRSTQRVSVGSGGEQANGSSRKASINADGSMVVFESFATTIAPDDLPRKPEDADRANDRSAVYVHQMQGGRTMMVDDTRDRAVRATPTRDGDAAISGDGTTMVFNELPLFEPPGGTVGEVAHGTMFRGGSCLVSPTFAVNSIMINGMVRPIGAMNNNVAIGVRPGDVLFFRMAANDALSCDNETMRIRLQAPQGGDVLPDGMSYIKDSDDCEGVGSAPLAAGILATADSDFDDDLILSCCWTPNVDDFLVNGGLYQLEFLADFPGALQPSRVTVLVQVQECELEVDLLPEFDPGFTSGAIQGESQFDLDGDGVKDFLSSFPIDAGNPSNRWSENVAGDLDLITLVPAEVATFDMFFTVDDANNGDPICPENNIEILDIVFPPTAPYQQAIPCTFGGGSSPPLPCFINLDTVMGLSSTGNIVVVAAPVFPLTKAQFEAAPGWINGEDLVSVRLTVTASPTSLDIGNNLVSFRITDTTGHISDPQVNFFVTSCFDPPCCLIDTYQITGVDDVTRDIPTEPIVVTGPGGSVELMCDGEPLLQPAGDGIIDVFPNQTVSFLVHGRMETDCPGASLTIDKDESGGDIFPAGVMCIDQDGAGLDFVCLGEPGAPDSDVSAYIEWTPTPEDIQTAVYILRFTVSDGAGRVSSCLVRIRVCPEPVCEGTVAVDDGEPMPLDFSNPLVPPSQTVTPGQTITLHICGTQDCGEFVEGTALDQAVYRTISIEPTEATCQTLCDLGCMSPDINCAVMPPVCLPVVVSDDPLLDSDNADGDMNNMTGAEDPFQACYDVVCTIPELDKQSTFDLCFTITDASGKPQECCVRLTVCPPVTCEPTNIMFNGKPAPQDFDPMTDTFTILPGEDNLSFKITGGGGCMEDPIEITGFEVVCFDESGAEIPLPTCEQDDECCTLDLPCEFTDINGLPVQFPLACDDLNMCMVNVTCSFGADWYGRCDKILVRAIVTADPGGPHEQFTTCGVMVDIGECPPPTCVVKNEMPELCTLTGDELDNAIVVTPGEEVSFDVNFLSDCFGAKLKWSATGIPTWMDPHSNGVPADTFECPNFTINCTGTPMMGDEGHYEVTFTVMDNTGQVSMCKVWIIVCDGPTCEIRVNEPEVCEESGYIEAYPGQKIDFDFITSSPCPIDAFEGRPIIVNWNIKGDTLPGLVCLPAAPAPGMFVPLTTGVLTSECTWTPTELDIGTYTVVFNTIDNCGRMNECEITIRVCERPRCLMTVLVNGSPVTYDPNDPESCVMMKPGEDLSVELCAMPGSDECNDLPLTLSLLRSPVGGPALTCNPVLPVMDVVDQQGMLCTTCTLVAGALDVSDSKYVWQFGIEDACGRVSQDLCELRVLVMPCDPPVCEITSVTVAGEAFDITGMEKPLVPILPGQELSYTVKGTLGCAGDGIDLDLLCGDLPTGAVVVPGELMVMDKVTMREWTITWTPKVTDDYCDTEVNFDCELVALPDGVASGSDQCLLNAEVGECPPPTCEDILVMVQPGGAGDFITVLPETDGCYVVQPGDVVMLDVVGTSNCPDGACNALTIIQKALPVGMMTPPLPFTGAVDEQVVSTFKWTVTEEDCGLDPTIIFNIAQDCGDSSEDCSVCFRVGDCENPPVCELSEFMYVPNPEMCFLKANEDDEEELCLDLPFEETPDGYMISVLPGDKVKLRFCGTTDCGCTTLTLDADGLPEDAEVFCDLDGDGEFEPSMFPCEGDPFPIEGMPDIRQLCSRVEFVVPPAGSFHITFTVSDSDADTPDAVCVLWVEVEDVCDDYEPNDECELPQVIDTEICGPYLSGQLEMRCTPGCQPDTFLVLFNKQNQIINMNNNSSTAGNGKASGLYNITTANGLSDGTGNDKWLRIGVTGYPDGLVQPFNGYPQNGPHGQLGEFTMTVTFFDGAGEIISPAVVQDANGDDVIIDNPFVYVNRFETGADAFRVNFQAPRALQGGGTTASASIEIDNTTGQDPLCDDVDFFRFTNLIPMTDYCIAMVGGYSKECTPLDAQLGWFDKQCEGPLAIDCDSGGAGYPLLCVISDINGEIIIGVTGKGDDDFDGYILPLGLPLADSRAVDGCPDPVNDHGVCGCYTLCIMTFDPHQGTLVDLETGDREVLEASLHHGDMNMDGVTDTADLGLLLGRYGWTSDERKVGGGYQSPGQSVSASKAKSPVVKKPAFGSTSGQE